MVKTLVLGAHYILSYHQIEYQVRDWLSFVRFFGLGLEDRVCAAKTVWLYCEGLARMDVVEVPFKAFDGCLARQYHIAGGARVLMPRSAGDAQSQNP